MPHHVPLAQVVAWTKVPDGTNPAPIANLLYGATNADDGSRSLCITALRIFGDSGTIDLSDPTMTQLVQQLADAGKITPNQQAALLALGADGT